MKNLQQSHQHWNDWKFLINWNDLEWVFPRSQNLKKKPFCTSSHKFYIKYKSTINHWIGHSIIKPIDANELFNRRVIISELEYSLNDDDTIGASVLTEG